jgi:uncharacterized protein (TIGR02001 family)
MNKKLIAILLSACAAGVVQIHAQTDAAMPTAAATPTPAAPAAAAPAAAPVPTPPAPPAWAYSVTPTYVSQYMFRGVRDGKDSIQGAFDATYGNWDLGIWGSNPLGQNKVPGQSEPEIDPYGSYKFALNDSWSIQPGATLYTYTKAPTNEGYYHATFEPNLAVNYTVGELTLTPKLYYDVVLKGPTEEFDAAYTVPLKDIGTELDFTGTVGSYYQYDTVNNARPHVKAYGNYWLLGVAVPYQLTKSLKLTVGYAYTQGSDAYFKQNGFRRVKNTAAQGKGVISVGLTYAW